MAGPASPGDLQIEIKVRQFISELPAARRLLAWPTRRSSAAFDAGGGGARGHLL